MFERFVKRFIIWYFLRYRQKAVTEYDDRFVIRVFTKDFYNNDVTEALREYRCKTKWINSENKKIKAIYPQIVVTGEIDNPYYNIAYYDTAKKEWYIGYGSYDLKIVRQWLNEFFEQVEGDMTEVVRCKDCKNCDCFYPNKKIGEEPKLEYFCKMGKHTTTANDYCSCGEREGKIACP